MLFQRVPTPQIGIAKGRVLQLLKRFLFVLDDQLRFILEHLVGQFEAFNALKLRINRFALHAWVVAEDALEHVLLSQLEAVLVRDLARYDASGWLRVPEVVHAQQFQDLQLLPDQLLLCQKVLLQHFNFGRPRQLLLLLRAQGHRTRRTMVWLAHALPGILNFANHHIDAFVVFALCSDVRVAVALNSFLMQIIHSLLLFLWSGCRHRPLVCGARGRQLQRVR